MFVQTTETIYRDGSSITALRWRHVPEAGNPYWRHPSLRLDCCDTLARLRARTGQPAPKMSVAQIWRLLGWIERRKGGA